MNQLCKIPKEKLSKIRNSWDIAATHKHLQDTIKAPAINYSVADSLNVSKLPSEMSNQTAAIASSLLGKRARTCKDDEINESCMLTTTMTTSPPQPNMPLRQSI